MRGESQEEEESLSSRVSKILTLYPTLKKGIINRKKSSRSLPIYSEGRLNMKVLMRIFSILEGISNL